MLVLGFRGKVSRFSYRSSYSPVYDCCLMFAVAHSYSYSYSYSFISLHPLLLFFEEGKQAVNASDFSIGQFRFLEPLILYHGRWGYMRTSMVVLYCFYKNFVIAGLLVLYNLETMYSGTSIFDQWLNSGFSFFAFCPILILGMFDRDFEKSYISKNPDVYKNTRQKELITARTLSRWIFMAIAHIIIL